MRYDPETAFWSAYVIVNIKNFLRLYYVTMIALSFNVNSNKFTYRFKT